MKVLFIARHFTYFRNFESVVVSLAERGHRVHLAADREEALGGRDLVERLAARFPDRVTVGVTDAVPERRAQGLAGTLRLGLDYLRYSDARYETAPKIRERAWERAPYFAVALADRLRGTAGTPLRGVASRILEAVEEAVPRGTGAADFIRSHRPDVLLITPLIELGSPQLDYLRAARAQGVRSALCVWSWDHLSSKALIRVVPDRVFVWNETQKVEARRFHGVAAEKVVVTGAQCFDQWFDRAPGRGADEFRRHVGLPPGRPFVLWVCSALFKNSPSEAAFVREWIAAIRRAPDPVVRDAAILVRPHPQRLEEWRDRAWLSEVEGVAIRGDNPVDDASRSDYFDSMFHAAAVAGLNTSALVEAAIVDRPVLTIMPPEFRDNQEGTLHFPYLLNVGRGFLHASRSLDEHAAQLAAVLRGAPSRNGRFVDEFIRPRGRAMRATDAFVAAVDALAALPVERARAPWWRPALRPVVYALDLASRTPGVERWFWSPVRRQERAANVVAVRRKQDQRRGKRRGKLSRLARKLREQAVVRTKTLAKHALSSAGLMKHS